LNSSCIQARGALTEEEKVTVNYCAHIIQAREAYALKTYAEVVSVDVQDLIKKVTDETLENAFKNDSSDGEILVYILPGDNLAVPLLGVEKSKYMTDYVHLRDLKCNLDNCSKKIKSKLHTLVVKGLPVCRHSLLGKEY
jgi:hypothetical protein